MNAVRNSRVIDSLMVPWGDFLPSWDWGQGEHVTLIGPTQSGKSTLTLQILTKRKYNLFLASKPKDKIKSELTAMGFKRVTDWPGAPVELAPWQMLAPPVNSQEDIARQRNVFIKALDDVYRSGGWTVTADELRYITQYLRLGPLLELLWQQGSTMKVTVVAGTQRPSHVPLVAYDQATHLFIFRESDDRNLKRLSEIGAVNASDVRAVVPILPKYHFLYVNTRSGEMAVSKVAK